MAPSSGSARISARNGPNETVIVPNCISFVEESKILFQKKNLLGTMKGSFGHYTVFQCLLRSCSSCSWPSFLQSRGATSPRSLAFVQQS